MQSGRYAAPDWRNKLIMVLLVLLILFIAAFAFALGFLLGQRYCNVHTHDGIAIAAPAATTEPPELVAPIPVTEPLEKLEDQIAIPGFSALELKASTYEQKLALSNPAENACLFRISLILEDGTVLWTSNEIKPGEHTEPMVLNQKLGPGEYPNAMLKYECFTMDEEKTALNGAETKLTLKVK